MNFKTRQSNLVEYSSICFLKLNKIYLIFFNPELKFSYNEKADFFIYHNQLYLLLSAHLLFGLVSEKIIIFMFFIDIGVCEKLQDLFPTQFNYISILF